MSGVDVEVYELEGATWTEVHLRPGARVLVQFVNPSTFAASSGRIAFANPRGYSSPPAWSCVEGFALELAPDEAPRKLWANPGTEAGRLEVLSRSGC